MIIFGTRGVTYRKDRGRFACPACGSEQDYALKRVRRFFTLYFIPVVPLDLLGAYVECGACKGTFEPDILTFDPTAAQAEFEAAFHTACRRVMIQMMMADGIVDDGEIAAIIEIYAGLTDRVLDAAEIRREADEIAASGSSLPDFLASVRGTLNDRGKELVVRAALQVAGADGEVTDDERLLLMRLGEAMDMTQAHLMGVMALVAQT